MPTTNPTSPQLSWEIERCVARFEEALRGAAAADPASFAPPAADPAYLACVTELARVDLEHGFERGRPQALSWYFERFPRLLANAAARAELCYEEYRLRRARGERPDPAEYATKYDVATEDWRRDGPAAAPPTDGTAPAFEALPSALWRQFASSQPERADRVAAAVAALPEVGAQFLDFELLAELGRGAFGRVFLARQATLADRRVALKIAPDLTGEPQTLAQLQHTNIVPIYSVHAAPPLHGLCMPYFGGTTLADVLQALRIAPVPRSSIWQLTNTVRLGKQPTRGPGAALPVQAAAPSAAAPRVPLGLAEPAAPPSRISPDYVSSVLGLLAQLADGLAHAHQRGVLHLDLKPANVLLADDGRPMLLDFNLAQRWQPADAAYHGIGGTLPYMAPEHLAAFEGAGVRLDGRADVYSLGLIFFELLYGTPAFPLEHGPLDELLPQMIRARRAGPARPIAEVPGVTPAVRAILWQCLEGDPARRYEAWQLRDDLQRQIAHRPLQHARDPSLRERFRKWRRRHPRLCSAASVAVVAGLLLAGALGAAGFLAAESAAHRARGQAATFAADKRQVEILLSLRDAPPTVQAAARAQAYALLTSYDALTDAAWDARPGVARLTVAERARLRGELGELAFLLARAERQAQRDFGIFSPQGEQFLPRLDALGAEAQSAGAPTDALESAAYLQATALLLNEDYTAALAASEQGCELHPDSFRLHFLRGLCLMHASRDGEAEAAFGVCLAVWPEFPWSRFNRALARSRQGRSAAAAADLDQLLAAAAAPVPSEVVRAAWAAGALGGVWLERGQVRRRLGDLPGAIADFTSAAEFDSVATTALLLRAEARAAAHDDAGAAADRALAFERTPTDPQSWVARGLARLPQDPTAAVQDFDRALELAPDYRPALQNKAYVLAELLHEPQAGRAALDRLLARYPEYVPALAGRAVLRARDGDRAGALADAGACLRLSGRTEVRYQVVCALAQTSRVVATDAARALEQLAALVAERDFDIRLLESDPDLCPLRPLPEFARLAAAAATLRGGAAED